VEFHILDEIKCSQDIDQFLYIFVGFHRPWEVGTRNSQLEVVMIGYGIRRNFLLLCLTLQNTALLVVAC